MHRAPQFTFACRVWRTDPPSPRCVLPSGDFGFRAHRRSRKGTQLWLAERADGYWREAHCRRDSPGRGANAFTLSGPTNGAGRNSACLGPWQENRDRALAKSRTANLLLAVLNSPKPDSFYPCLSCSKKQSGPIGWFGYRVRGDGPDSSALKETTQLSG
jgi:hypothetical protein